MLPALRRPCTLPRGGKGWSCVGLALGGVRSVMSHRYLAAYLASLGVRARGSPTRHIVRRARLVWRSGSSAALWPRPRARWGPFRHVVGGQMAYMGLVPPVGSTPALSRTVRDRASTRVSGSPVASADRFGHRSATHAPAWLACPGGRATCLGPQAVLSRTAGLA